GQHVQVFRDAVGHLSDLLQVIPQAEVHSKVGAKLPVVLHEGRVVVVGNLVAERLRIGFLNLVGKLREAVAVLPLSGSAVGECILGVAAVKVQKEQAEFRHVAGRGGRAAAGKRATHRRWNIVGAVGIGSARVAGAPDVVKDEVQVDAELDRVRALGDGEIV